MEAEYMPPERRDDLRIQDPHRVVQCSGNPDHLWIQHHNGVYRSLDGGYHWKAAHPKPSHFGFAVAVHPRDPQIAWFVPAVKDECRIPVDGRFVVTRTQNGGKTFEVLTQGLPVGLAYDLVFRHGLDVDESGSQLVLGSTTGSLWVSEDQGDSWVSVTSHLPPIYCLRWVLS